MLTGACTTLLRCCASLADTLIVCPDVIHKDSWEALLEECTGFMEHAADDKMQLQLRQDYPLAFWVMDHRDDLRQLYDEVAYTRGIS